MPQDRPLGQMSGRTLMKSLHNVQSGKRMRRERDVPAAIAGRQERLDRHKYKGVLLAV